MDRLSAIPSLGMKAEHTAPAWRCQGRGHHTHLCRSLLGIDLTKLDVPVLAIYGELDDFHAKTHRLEGEVSDFTNVMLPGKSHLSAIEPGYIPDEHIEATVAFVRKNDPR